MQVQLSAAERADRTRELVIERARNAQALLETHEHGPQHAFSSSSARRRVSFDLGESGASMAGSNSKWEQAKPPGRPLPQSGKGRGGILPSLTKSHSLSSLDGDGDIETELESALNSFANMGTEQHRRFVDHRLRKAQGNDDDWDQGIFFAPGARVMICGQDDSGVVQIYDGREGLVISEDGRDRYLVQLTGASELCQLSLRAENLQQLAEKEFDDNVHQDPARRHIQPARDFANIHQLATLHAEQNAKRAVEAMYQEADEQKRRIEQTARAEAFFRTDLMTTEINQLFRERCSYGKKCGRPGCKFLHPWDAQWAGRTVCGSDSKAMYKISRSIYEKHTPTIGGNRGKGGGQKVPKRSKSQTDHHSPRSSPQKPPAGNSFPRSMADVNRHDTGTEAGTRITPFERNGDGCLAEHERRRVLPSAGSVVGGEMECVRADSRNEAVDDRIQRGARRAVLAELKYAQSDNKRVATFEDERLDSDGAQWDGEEERKERIRWLAEQKKLELRQRKKRVQAEDLDTSLDGEEASQIPFDSHSESPKQAQERQDSEVIESSFLEVEETAPSPGSEQRSAQDTESGVPSPQLLGRAEGGMEDEEEKKHKISQLIELKKMELRRSKVQAENEELHALLHQQQQQQQQEQLQLQLQQPEHEQPQELHQHQELAAASPQRHLSAEHSHSVFHSHSVRAATGKGRDEAFDAFDAESDWNAFDAEGDGNEIGGDGNEGAHGVEEVGPAQQDNDWPQPQPDPPSGNGHLLRSQPTCLARSSKLASEGDEAGPEPCLGTSVVAHLRADGGEGRSEHGSSCSGRAEGGVRRRLQHSDRSGQHSDRSLSGAKSSTTASHRAVGYDLADLPRPLAGSSAGRHRGFSGGEGRALSGGGGRVELRGVGGKGAGEKMRETTKRERENRQRTERKISASGRVAGERGAGERRRNRVSEGGGPDVMGEVKGGGRREAGEEGMKGGGQDGKEGGQLEPERGRVRVMPGKVQLFT